MHEHLKIQIKCQGVFPHVMERSLQYDQLKKKQYNDHCTKLLITQLVVSTCHGAWSQKV